MQSYSFTEELKKILPENNWAQVFSALLQDKVVWESLAGETFGHLALEKAGGEPANWSPGFVALLAINYPIDLEHLQKEPLQPIPDKLRRSAATAHEEANQSQFRGSELTLEKAGLLALSLRERWQLLGSWDDLLSEISNPIDAWKTSLACLYTLLPDNNPYLISLFGYPERFNAGLHVILSNPLEADARTQNLAALVYDKPRTEQVAVLQILQNKNSRAAQDLALRLSENFLNEQSSENQTIEEVTQKAIISQAAGEHSKAMSYLNDLWDSSRSLQTKLAIGLARSALQKDDKKTAQAALEQISILGSNSPEIKAEAALAKLAAGAGAVEELANEATIEVDSKNASTVELILAARATQNSNPEKARELSLRALEMALIRRDTTHLDELATLLLKLNLSAAAAEAIELALETTPNSGRLLHLQSKAYLAGGEAARAIEKAQLATGIEPAELDFRRQLAAGYAAAEEWEKALREADTILARQANPEIADLLLAATCALRAEKPERAIEVCGQAIELDPGNGGAHLLLGQAFSQTNDVTSAEREFDKAMQLAPQLPEAWIETAKHYSQNNHTAKAIKTLEQGIKKNPEAAELYFTAGQAYLEDGSKKNAKKAFEKSAQLISASADTANNLPQRVAAELGNTLLDLEEYEQALAVLEQAHQSSPADAEIAHLYGRALSKNGRWEKAISAFSIKVERRPDEADIYLDHGEALLALGKDPASALANIHKALEIDPGNWRANALLAEAHEKMGNHEEALHSYQQALDTDLTQNVEILTQMYLGASRCALALSKPDIAIACLKDAKGKDPDNLPISKMLAESYAAAELPQDALQIAREVGKISAGDAEALIWFADIALRLEANEEALQALAKIPALGAERTDILVRAGNIYLLLDRPEEAIDLFKQLLQSKQVEAKDLQAAAHALKTIDEYDAALQLLQKAVTTVETPHADLLKDLAGIQLGVNDYQAALGSAEKALEQNPEDLQLLRINAEALEKLGRPQAALACLDKALEINPDDFHLNRKAALALWQVGEFANALSRAEYAARLNPKDLASNYYAAEIAIACLEPEKALELLSRARPLIKNSALAPLALDAVCLLGELLIETQAPDELEELIQTYFGAEVPEHARSLALFARFKCLGHERSAAIDSLEKAAQALHEIAPSTESFDRKQRSKISVAEAALDMNDWPRAIALLSEAVQSNEHNPLAQIKLAQALVLRAEHQYLCRDLDARANAPGEEALAGQAHDAFNQTIETAMRLVPFESGKKLLANLCLRGQIAFQPHSPMKELPDTFPSTAGEAAAFMAYARRQHDAPLVVQTARKYRGDANVMVQLAIALAQDKPGEALQAAEQALMQAAISPVHLALAGRLAHRAGEQEKSLEYFEQALEIWPDEASWRVFAAQTAHEAQKIADASRHLEQAAALDPQNAETAYLLAKSYLNEASPGNAVRALERFQSKDTANAKIFLLLAEAHRQLGEYGQADKFAETACKLAPKQIEPLMARAEVALEAGEAEHALEHVRTALTLKPEDPAIFLLQTKILEALGQLQEAVAVIEKALQLATEPLPLLLEKAKLIEQLQGGNAGLRNLIKLSKEHPEDPKVLSALAQSLLAADQIDEAIRAAQQALRVSQKRHGSADVGQYHYQLGRLLRKAGQLDQSIHHLTEAIKLHPANAESLLEIGYAYRERRQDAEALAFFEQAIDANPNDPRGYLEAAAILKESKDYTGAENMLRRAAGAAPKDVNIQRQLGAVVALNLVHPSTT